MEQLNKFRDMITFGLMFVFAFIWMETQYVDAGELKQYIESQASNEIFYLEQKKLRLEREGKQLDTEDQLLLDRLKREEANQK